MKSLHTANDSPPTILWCLLPESNQRHVDFQSTALPTELRRQITKNLKSVHTLRLLEKHYLITTFRILAKRIICYFANRIVSDKPSPVNYFLFFILFFSSLTFSLGWYFLNSKSSRILCSSPNSSLTRLYQSPWLLIAFLEYLRVFPPSSNEKQSLCCALQQSDCISKSI